MAQVFEREFIKFGGQIVLETAVNKGDMDLQTIRDTPPYQEEIIYPSK